MPDKSPNPRTSCSTRNPDQSQPNLQRDLPENRAQIASWSNTIFEVETKTAINNLPANMIDCVVTSPPYWGKIDYGVENQLGTEDKAQSFVGRLTKIGKELQRVTNGSIWLNIGDTYNGNSIIRPDTMQSHTRPGDDGYKAQLAANRDKSGIKRRSTKQYGINRRSRLFIPSRIATTLAENGLICRDKVIWYKPAPKPEGRVQSRLTQSHELLYRFITDESAYFDRDAMKNPTDVWKIPTTQTNDDAHPAPFPDAIARRAIKLTTEPGDIVFDPFAGSGTTCRVAAELGRKYIGFELHPEFATAAAESTPVVPTESNSTNGQQSLTQFD